MAPCNASQAEKVYPTRSPSRKQRPPAAPRRCPRRRQGTDRAHSGESMQSNRNREGCRLCPPEPMAAHGHVNGWREAPGWSEAEGFGGHSLSLTDIAKTTGVPAKPQGATRSRWRLLSMVRSRQVGAAGRRGHNKTDPARGSVVLDIVSVGCRAASHCRKVLHKQAAALRRSARPAGY